MIWRLSEAQGCLSVALSARLFLLIPPRSVLLPTSGSRGLPVSLPLLVFLSSLRLRLQLRLRFRFRCPILLRFRFPPIPLPTAHSTGVFWRRWWWRRRRCWRVAREKRFGLAPATRVAAASSLTCEPDYR